MTEYNALVEQANCNTYNFSCRAKQDTYNVGAIYVEWLLSVSGI